MVDVSRKQLTVDGLKPKQLRGLRVTIHRDVHLLTQQWLSGTMRVIASADLLTSDQLAQKLTIGI